MIAVIAVAAHATYGNVDVGDGLLVGLPAVAGVVGGTSASAASVRARHLSPVRGLLVVVALVLLIP